MPRLKLTHKPVSIYDATPSNYTLKPFVIMSYPTTAFSDKWVKDKVISQFVSLGYEVVDVPLTGTSYSGRLPEFKFMPEGYDGGLNNGHSNGNGNGNRPKSVELKAPVKHLAKYRKRVTK